MKQALRALLVYLALLAFLWPSFQGGSAEPEPALPLLPAEAVLNSGGARDGLCASEGLLRSLGARSFRWVYRASERAPLWRHGLTVLCEPSGPEFVTIGVLRDGKPVYQGKYRRAEGVDGDDTTARVIARLLPLQKPVAEAGVRAFLDNQAEVARAAADLWRAKRWKPASTHLFLALTNDWDEAAQADLYFGLAESDAHLGRPRQAFWYALSYLALTRKEPPAEWLRSLRGAAGLIASQPPNVEPETAEFARQLRQSAAAKHWDLAAAALERLCQAAPWAWQYQEAAARLYGELGWKALSESWARRAAFTRRLVDDQALQARLTALVR